MMEKVSTDRLFSRFRINSMKGIGLGMPRLYNNRRGFGELEILLD